MSAFQEAHTTAGPETIVLAVYTFISKELQFFEKTDKDTFSSLTKAIQSFDWKERRIPRQYNKFLHDAFFALKSVEKPDYKITDDVFPHSRRYRAGGFPRDVFHIACIGHKTRLRKILRSPA